MSYMSHKEKYEEAVRRATIALKLLKKLQQDGFGGTDFMGYSTHIFNPKLYQFNDTLRHFFRKVVLPFSGILKQGSPISKFLRK